MSEQKDNKKQVTQLSAQDLKQVPGVLGPESDWWTIAASYILNKHTTFCVGWGNLGNLVDSQANGAWCFQMKYEF